MNHYDVIEKVVLNSEDDRDRLEQLRSRVKELCVEIDRLQQIKVRTVEELRVERERVRGLFMKWQKGLIRRRIKAGYKRSEVAMFLIVEYQTVFKWEKGTLKVSSRNAKKLAKLYDYPLNV